MSKRLDSYEALKTIYKVGHPISVTVVGYEPMDMLVDYRVYVETSNGVKGSFNTNKTGNPGKNALPEIGESLIAIIKNYHSENNRLYLSIEQEDLEESTINSFKKFYELIDKMKEGTIVTGTVLEVRPFGLFVDIGHDFAGLIDIGHSQFNQGTELPLDNSKWPKKGDSIQCIVSYYRFHNKQFGFGWLPEK